MVALLLVLLVAAGTAFTAAAQAGWQGQVGRRWSGGPGLPAGVEADPVLRAQADRLVRTWCTAAAVLTVPPVVLLAVPGLWSPEPLTLSAAGLCAAYAFALVVVAGHPFEKIRDSGAP